MNDPLLPAAQDLVDHDRPGWTVAHYITVVGLQRIQEDGGIESAIVRYTPEGQPPYVSDGLLDHATRLGEFATEESE